MNEKNYVVSICGYEGLEAVFSPFTREEAHEFYLELRASLPERIKSTEEEENIHFNSNGNETHWCKYCSDLAVYNTILDGLQEKYGLFFTARPDQVCIMRGDNNKKVMQCVCEEFPDRSVNKGQLY